MFILSEWLKKNLISAYQSGFFRQRTGGNFRRQSLDEWQIDGSRCRGNRTGT